MPRRRARSATPCAPPSGSGSRASTSTGVTVTFDRADEGVLLIDIGYAIRGSNDPRNLVFPFYVIPDRTSERPP